MTPTTEIRQAQADVRRIYSGGWGGPAVSAIVWLAAGLVAARGGVAAGATVLLVGGALLIFPVNLVLNRLMSGQSDLPAGHPMRGLAIQTAATMAVVLLALWLVAEPLGWTFFPLAMIAVGSHYFPFAHLYGSRTFIAIGAIQCLAGFGLLLASQGEVTAYVMAGLLAASAAVLALRHKR